MIREEMMARMPAREFFERMERERRAVAATENPLPSQTPEEMLSVIRKMKRRG